MKFLKINALVGMLCISTSAAFAQAQPPADPLDPVFDQIQASGMLAENIKVSKIPAGNIELDFGGGDRRSVRGNRALVLDVQVPLLSSKINLVAALREINNQVQDVCTQNNGELDQKPVAVFPRGEDAKILGPHIRELETQRLSGRFICFVNNARLFQVNVAPAALATPTLFPPGVAWKVYVNEVGPKQLEPIEQRVADHAKAVEEFRNTLQPGVAVAVPAKDVPAALLPKLPPEVAGEMKFMVCGLVIQAQPQLVQVQVGQGLFFVQSAKVLPVKMKLDANGRTLFRSGSWTDWCVNG